MKPLVRAGVAALAFMVAVLGGAVWGRAQGKQTPPVFEVVPQVQGVPSPLILSGPDIGFRVERRKGTSVVGRFVVRVDGQWLDAESGVGLRVLTTGH